jgi:hypothetical protein
MCVYETLQTLSTFDATEVIHQTPAAKSKDKDLQTANTKFQKEQLPSFVDNLYELFHCTHFSSKFRDEL